MGRDRSPGGTGQAGVKSEQARRVHNKRDRDMQPLCQEPRPLVSSRPSSCNLICNLLLFYIGAELISNLLFVLGVHELDSVMHRCVSILSLFFFSLI